MHLVETTTILVEKYVVGITTSLVATEEKR